MRKKLFLSIAILFLSLNIHAQTIQGTIVDDESGKPINQAAVALFNHGETTPLKQAYSDANGNFKFDVGVNKSFLLKIRYLGYKTKEIAIRPFKKPIKIKMTKTSELLQEVKIEGTRARAVLKGDTVEYDAKAFKTHKNANVEDLVRKMPGITKENGEIKAYGEKVQKVLVDGEEFFGEDANIALKNLPAETVDKVEIYDALNDKDAFTGFNSGNTIKTMNLKTKMKKSQGLFGKAYGGYGTNSRYQMGGNFNQYNGSQRLSILGLSNNINNLNFSTSELVGALTGSSSMGGARGRGMMRGMSFGMSVAGSNRRFGGPMSNFTVSNQDGVNSAHSFGINYNDKWGKNKNVKINSSYFGNRTDNTTISETKRSNIIDTNSRLNTLEKYNGNSTGYNHKFTSRMTSHIDKNNSIIWTNKLTFDENNSYSTSNTENGINENTSVQSVRNKSQTNSFNSKYNTNFLYRMKLKRRGRTFSVNTVFDINQETGESNQSIENLLQNFSNSLRYDLKQWSTTVTNVLTYTEPSGRYGQWLFNYSPSLSYRSSDRDVWNTTGSSELLADSLSGHIKNNIFYNVGGISYRLQFKKLRVMFGSNVQHIDFKANDRLQPFGDVNKDFFGVLPYFNIKFNPKRMFRMMLRYSTSMNVPAVSEIQPVLDLSNPLSLYKGNENLENEYSHNLFFHFMKPNISKGTFLIFVSNFNTIFNRISDYSYSAVTNTEIDGVQLRRGQQYNKNVNLDGFYSGFVFGNYTFPVKKLKSNLSLNSSISTTRTPSIVNDIENITRTHMFSFGTMLSSNISSDIDFSISYNPKRFINTFSLPEIDNNNFWMHTVATNLKYTFSKNWTFSSDFSYNYNSQVDPSLNQHVFLLGASMAYRLLKDRNLEAKFSVFDLFDQNRNISRTVTNNSIIDNNTNAMNRYGMFSLIYHFKKFQGKDPDKNSKGFFRLMHPKSD